MAGAIGNVRAMFTASSGGMVQATGAAGAALKRLGVDVRGLGSAMQILNGLGSGGLENIGPAGEKAEKTFRLLQGRLEGLAKQLESGTITADEYAASIARINAIAAEQSSLMQRGAAVTREHMNAFERFDESLAEADRLLSAGAIAEETYRRSVEKLNKTLEDSTGYTQARADATREAEAEAKRAADAMATEKLEAAAAAERRLTDAMREGAAVTRSVETAEERHARTVSNLNSLLIVGAIDHQTYARAVDKADDELRQETASATRAATATDKVADAAGRADRKLSALVAINAAQLFGSIAATASNAARSVLSWGAAEGEAIDQTSKLAARVGMTYGELQGLKAVEDDLSFDAIAMGATKLDVALVRAAQGSTTAKAALDGVGLSVADLQGMSAAERFEKVADSIAKIPTEAERSAAAVRIFGKAGAGLLPLFNQGAGAIEAAREKAAALGLALTQEQTGNVQGMKDSFEQAGKAIQGVIQQVVAHLSPAITAVMTTFTDLVGSVGGANIGQTIGEGLMAGARFLAGVGDALMAGLTGVWDFAGTVAEVWTGVWDFAGRYASMWLGVGRGLQGAFLAMLSGATGLLGLISKQAANLSKEFGRASKDSFSKAGQNFASAFGPKAAGATAGPLTAMLNAAEAKAKAAAKSVDTTTKATFESKGISGQEASRSLAAVDSRSTDGVKEMFRLIRGGQDDIQEQQLTALEQIADNTADGGMDVLELDFAR